MFCRGDTLFPSPAKILNIRNGIHAGTMVSSSSLIFIRISSDKPCIFSLHYFQSPMFLAAGRSFLLAGLCSLLLFSITVQAAIRRSFGQGQYHAHTKLETASTLSNLKCTPPPLTPYLLRLIGIFH